MNEPLVLTRAQIRRVDQLAVERYSIPSLLLMENAGRGCVDRLLALKCEGPVVVLCGAGNNGGDGFVIARHLAVRGVEACCLLASDPTRLSGDAAINFQALDRLGLPWRQASGSEAADDVARCIAQARSIVDALLGTGASGPPRPDYARLIQLANAAAGKRIAIDLPSGLDCDSGIASDPTFHAAHTFTFVAAKPGLLAPSAAAFVGQTWILDIGLPPTAIEAAIAP